MGKGGYGPSMMVKIGLPTGAVHIFGKREVRGSSGPVCNRCVRRMKAGEKGKQTRPGAWRHHPSCPVP